MRCLLVKKELRAYIILLGVSSRERQWTHNNPLFLLKRFYQQHPTFFCPAKNRNKQRRGHDLYVSKTKIKSNLLIYRHAAFETKTVFQSSKTHKVQRQSSHTEFSDRAMLHSH